MKTDWAAVYREAHRDVFAFLAWKLGDEDRALDLAQEAFARVLDREADDPRSLVFRVAANLARDEVRLVVRRRRHLKLVRVEEDVRAEAATPPDLALERREGSRRVREALARLSETDREVLLLWNAGLSYDEIAGSSGLARGSIGTTIARAKRKLVAAYEAGEVDDAARG